MAELDDHWPVLAWRLTAPESYALRYGADGHAHEAFKLAVKELVARKALRIETATAKSFARSKTVAVLSEGPRAAAARQENSLAPVLATFDQLEHKWVPTDRGTIKGIDLRAFARAASKKFSRGFRPPFALYRDTLFFILIDRGLVEQGRNFVRTSNGRYADDELDVWLRIGKERLGAWIQREPARALAYAGGAGPALLLVNQIYGVELDELRHHAAAVGFAGGGDGGGDWGSDGGLGGFDFGGLDFGGLDFSGIDFSGLDGAFGSIDVGFAAGGGGGDSGGGGDGGGGG